MLYRFASADTDAAVLAGAVLAREDTLPGFATDAGRMQAALAAHHEPGEQHGAPAGQEDEHRPEGAADGGKLGEVGVFHPVGKRKGAGGCRSPSCMPCVAPVSANGSGNGVGWSLILTCVAPGPRSQE